VTSRKITTTRHSEAVPGTASSSCARQFATTVSQPYSETGTILRLRAEVVGYTKCCGKAGWMRPCSARHAHCTDHQQQVCAAVLLLRSSRFPNPGRQFRRVIGGIGRGYGQADGARGWGRFPQSQLLGRASATDCRTATGVSDVGGATNAGPSDCRSSGELVVDATSVALVADKFGASVLDQPAALTCGLARSGRATVSLSPGVCKRDEADEETTE